MPIHIDIPPVEGVEARPEREAYVITHGDHVSGLGFDVCLDRIERYEIELMVEPRTVTRGSLEAFAYMRGLVAALEQRFKDTGEQAVSELSPQLIGLEGWRVEVEASYGETRRFVVGKSMGWMPIHLELSRRDSSGGIAADREYKSVRAIEKVR